MWWDEIEMLFENKNEMKNGESNKENKESKESKMLEKMWENTEKKLKTIYNGEITKSNILKLETLVNDIDNFKWVV